MKQKHILKWLGIALGVYLLYGVLTAILVPLPQKEAAGELWSQYEARLSEDASQERVRSIEDTDSALLWRLQLIESAEREVIFSTFDLRADGSGQDLMAALYGAAQRGVRVRVIVDGLNGFLHLQNSGVLRALAAEENVEVRFYDPIDLLRPWKLNYRLHDKYLIADAGRSRRIKPSQARRPRRPTRCRSATRRYARCMEKSLPPSTGRWRPRRSRM